MKRVSLFLKKNQIQKLKELAQEQQDPWSLMVRDTIDFYIEIWEELAKKELTKDAAELKRVSLFLKEKQIRKLKALSQKWFVPSSMLVRDAIDFYIETSEKAREQSAKYPAESNQFVSEMKGDKK